jgi:hypothetical protein
MSLLSLTDEELDAVMALASALRRPSAETVREGFPSGEAWHSPAEFVVFCQTHRGCSPDSEVARIEYAYL